MPTLKARPHGLLCVRGARVSGQAAVAKVRQCKRALVEREERWTRSNKLSAADAFRDLSGRGYFSPLDGTDKHDIQLVIRT